MAKDTTSKKSSQAATTSVGVDFKTSAKLKKLAKKNGVSQGQLISLMLQFFEETGFKVDDLEAGKTSINDLKKQVKSFEDEQKKSRNAMWQAEAKFEKQERNVIEIYQTFQAKMDIALSEIAAMSAKIETMDAPQTAQTPPPAALKKKSFTFKKTENGKTAVYFGEEHVIVQINHPENGKRLTMIRFEHRDGIPILAAEIPEDIDPRRDGEKFWNTFADIINKIGG